jgi:hypothetical protein
VFTVRSEIAFCRLMLGTLTLDHKGRAGADLQFLECQSFPSPARPPAAPHSGQYVPRTLTCGTSAARQGCFRFLIICTTSGHLFAVHH